MKKIVLAVTICSIFISQKVSASDTLYWDSNQKLTWNDFKAKPGKSPSGTGSYIGLEYELTNDNTSFKPRVYTYFLTNISWSAFKTDTLLEHEQVRFDMAELFARKTRKAFAEYNYNRASVAKDLKKIFNEIKDQRTDMNDQYNKETKYGTDWKAQRAWANKIGQELDRFGSYAE